MGWLAGAWIAGGRVAARLRRAPVALPPFPDVYLAHARGRSFVDVGTMWAVHGRYAFEAEAGGAERVTAVDVMEETEAFRREHERRGSRVRFVRGDVNDPATVDEVGRHDIVWCSGVLYHSPSPLLTVERLCSLAGEVLLLASKTLPELPGAPQACVLYPGLAEGARRPYARVFRNATAVSSPFDPDSWYGNWWWGITPSALVSMVAVQPGFTVVETVRARYDTLVVARRE